MEELIYVGTYSTQGLYKLSFLNGHFTLLATSSIFENCSYLCKSQNYLYHVVEESHNPIYASGCIVARTFQLDVLNYQLSFGRGPCFVTIDPIRNILYLANYGDGSLIAFSLEKDGSIGNVLYSQKYQHSSRLHYICLSYDYHYLFAIDLGDNKLFAYQIEYQEEQLTLTEICTYCFPKNVGPRHMVIDKSNKIYLLSELSCELYTITFDCSSFRLIQVTSLLPKNVLKESHFTGCAIKMSSDSKFLYTSIRGYNGISVFEIGKNRLTWLQTISCFGKTPRDISFNQKENFLICANQDSNQLSIFKREPLNGKLEFYCSYNLDSPACIL